MRVSLRWRPYSSAHGELTHMEVRLLSPAIRVGFMQAFSDIGLPREDRSRLATFRARTPRHQLGLCRRLDVPSPAQDTILLFVRRGVRLIFLFLCISPIPFFVTTGTPLLAPRTTLFEIQHCFCVKRMMEMSARYSHVSAVRVNYMPMTRSADGCDSSSRLLFEPTQRRSPRPRNRRRRTNQNDFSHHFTRLEISLLR